MGLKSIITAAVLFALGAFHEVYGQYHSQLSFDEIQTAEGAKACAREFFKQTIPEAIIQDASPFILKTIAGHQYALAKVLLVYHAHQSIVGLVYDLDFHTMSELPQNEFRRFLKTGDRSLIEEPNLDPSHGDH